ncbi:uncharacterized protein LOC126900071 [Daktulosphaira vitifoliae]|uniref:uncharacterized protein LOC126900071 n=1 Tax=Daktulosphaira vitifoliae TaxID=58002 RepID=UPI0021AA6B00|nr:uncharacterized protein LOC126900071 [Daktulosphaira vitifoliae]
MEEREDLGSTEGFLCPRWFGHYDADSFCVVSRSLKSFKICGPRFQIKVDPRHVNWTRVANKKLISHLNTVFLDDNNITYNEFVLGSFVDCHLINALIRSNCSTEIPKCRWQFITEKVYSAIKNLHQSSKTYCTYNLPSQPQNDGQVIVYNDDWSEFCESLMAVAAPTFADVQLYFYVAKHGIKDASLSTVNYMIDEAVNMDCPQLICIQLHLAASNHAVILKRNRVSKVVTAEITH